MVGDSVRITCPLRRQTVIGTIKSIRENTNNLYFPISDFNTKTHDYTYEYLVKWDNGQMWFRDTQTSPIISNPTLNELEESYDID